MPEGGNVLHPFANLFNKKMEEMISISSIFIFSFIS